MQDRLRGMNNHLLWAVLQAFLQPLFSYLDSSMIRVNEEQMTIYRTNCIWSTSQYSSGDVWNGIRSYKCGAYLQVHRFGKRIVEPRKRSRNLFPYRNIYIFMYVLRSQDICVLQDCKRTRGQIDKSDLEQFNDGAMQRYSSPDSLGFESPGQGLVSIPIALHWILLMYWFR